MVYVCDGCGACCRTWVLVTPEDARREPRLTVEGRALRNAAAERTGLAYQLFPLPFLESCSFLGADARCGIYTTRPQVCRDFEAGGSRCQEARRLAGRSPLPPD